MHFIVRCIISLFKGIDNTGTFKVGLKKGVYGACRVMLFNSPDGKSSFSPVRPASSTRTDESAIRGSAIRMQTVDGSTANTLVTADG